MKKNSFGQGLAVFLVIVGVLFIIGSIGEASEPKCIKTGCDNKQASGSSYCYLHKPYTGSSSSHSSSSYSNNSSSSTSKGSTSTSGSNSSYSNKSNTTNNSSYSSGTKKVLRQKRVLMILMMMDMMTSIWMEIMTMTDTTVIVTTLTVWMMQWMSLEKTGKAEGGHYHGANVFYNSWL